MILKFGRLRSRVAPYDCPVQLDLTRVFEHKSGLAWSDTDVQALRFGLLVDAIKSLRNPRVGAVTRSGLLDWIANDAMTPFSFRVCCIAEALDPDALCDLLAARTCRARQTG